ncbi:MAG: flippase-like domain-containing protein [Flavobacteriales bacterium]|nr:flippase-like domain-containing protein [Flavobacteriales bacterium]
MSQKRILNVLKYLVFLGIGFGLLWFVTRNQDLTRMKNELMGARWNWVILSMSVAILSHVFRAARWNMLINTMGFSTKLTTTFHATMSGYFANLIVPRLGEVTRCGILARKNGIPIQGLLGTVIVERGLDLLSLMLITLFTILFQIGILSDFLNQNLFDPLQQRVADNTSFIWLALGGAVVLLVASGYLIKRSMHRMRQRGGGLFFKLKRIWVGFTGGMKTIKRMKNKGLFILYTLLIWVCYYLMVYLCFFALDATEHLSVGAGFTTLAMGSLGIVAPVPGGMGTYHYIVSLTLTEIYLVAESSAVSFAYLVHSSQTLVILVVGAISLFLLTIKSKTLKAS